MTVLLFLRDLLLATFGQMVSLLAGVFVIGLLLHFSSHLTFKSLENAFGRKGVYLVAWLGTPIHELGHAFFCFLFLHRIEEIRLFSPDPVTGTLGYVNHTWNRRNPWAVLGNFFIGIGPVILGSAVLFGLFLWLVPGGSAAWDSIMDGVRAAGDFTSWRSYVSLLGDSSLAMVRAMFTVENLGTWRFWIFLYLAVCVASNLRLSLSDIKGALSGVGWLVLPFLVVNLIGMVTGNEGFFPVTASTLGAAYAVLVLALVISLIGFVIVYIFASLCFRLRRRVWLNPFS